MFPHQTTFRFRGLLFWLAAMASLFMAARVPGVNRKLLLLSAAVAVVVTISAYYYTMWLVRLDARFRDVHPRKFAVTTLITFYGGIVLAAASATVSLWLIAPTPDAPIGRVICLMLVPIFLASSAAAVRVRSEAEQNGARSYPQDES